MKLRKIKSITLTPLAPFNFDATFHKPAHFPSTDNLWRPGTRWQTWFWQGKQLGLKFVDVGSLNHPQINLNLYYSHQLDNQFIDSLVKEIRYRYNLDLDLTRFYRTFAKDKFLAPVINRWRGLRPGHQNSLYEYLIIGIVLQNTIVKRSIQMLQSLFENYGTLLEFDRQQLWCFWPPGGLTKASEADLRTLKLGYRAKSIKKIDDQFAHGLVDEFRLRHQSLDEQKEALLKLYGVGPATVWYLLFDVFHHYDFFDHISPWEQKIYSKLFFNQDPEKPIPVGRLLKLFQRYGQYRQLAVHYIWEDLWWQRKNQPLPWLEKLIRI